MKVYDRIRAAWYALNGAAVLHSPQWILIATDDEGKMLSTGWNGLIAEHAAKALYQAADAVVDKLPMKSHTTH